MAEYTAPLEDIQFTLKYLVKVDRLSKHPLFADATEELNDTILLEASKIAQREIAPTNHSGDQSGCSIDDQGRVTTPAGFAQAYKAFAQAGWPSLQFDPQWGGQGLPFSLSLAVMEMVQSANMAWSLCPLLTQGAIDAIDLNASDALKLQFLPNMVSGQWTGSMNLTEPQAGSDLALIKTSAVPEQDHYLLKGQKIFITWGEHDVAENIIHLVLARLPDAPPGVKGISLFIVPKFLLKSDGSLGQRNDCKAISLEHKLGIHASPTCVMSFGDEGGAIGYLVGEQHRGLACMFTMMNSARLMVGLQGTAIAQRALQDAIEFAAQRKQGNMPSEKTTCTIDQHPDVQRMLMTMRALTQASRALVYVGCSGLDFERIADSEPEQSAIESRISLLTPIIKGWATEVSQEVTYLGIQVHGGMGFIEETRVAQHYRDARILTIYEGTTGIQAIDLAGRKTIYDKGKAFKTLIDEINSDISRIKTKQSKYSAYCAALSHTTEHLTTVIEALVKQAQTQPALASEIGNDLLYLSGYLCGGWQMLLTLEACELAQGQSDVDTSVLERHSDNAHFYLRYILPRTLSYAACLDTRLASLAEAQA